MVFGHEKRRLLAAFFGFFALYFYFSSWDGFTTPKLFGVYLLWNVEVGVAVYEEGT
jgi:hypothetical protein